MPVIYTLIARPPDNLLIDCTNPAHTGNFSEISKKILANIPKAQQADGQKVTFVFEGHTFNFRADRGLLFMCMCDEQFGRSKPFVFLKDIIDTFFLMFAGDETVLEGSISRSFKGVLTQKLKNYSAPSSAPSLSASLAAAPAAADPKLAKMKQVQESINDLASSAKQNMEKVINRGEAIESLRDRSGALHMSSDVFRKHSKKLNQRLCMENLKLKLLIAVVIACCLYFLLAARCGMDLHKCF